jgi:hypothetical protein
VAKKISESRSDSRGKMRRPTLKWLENAQNYSGEPKVKRCQEKGIDKNDHVIKVGKVLRAPWSKGISTSLLSK